MGFEHILASDSIVTVQCYTARLFSIDSDSEAIVIYAGALRHPVVPVSGGTTSEVLEVLVQKKDKSSAMCCSHLSRLCKFYGTEGHLQYLYPGVEEKNTHHLGSHGAINHQVKNSKKSDSNRQC